MKALIYEHLLREIYQCSRTNKKGANADYYRDMESAYRDLETKSMFNNQEEREYHFRVQFSIVRGYLYDALNESLNNVYNKDTLKIKELINMLSLDFFDVEKLNEIIKEASDIIFKNNTNKIP